MTRPIPAFLPDWIKKVEGSKAKAYRDSAGVWTIGVGHTGPEVMPGLVWTPTQVNKALLEDLRTAAARLASVTKDAVIRKLTDHQYGALVSFVFNLGANPKWIIWKVLNSGQLDGVPAQMMRFTKAKVDGQLVEVKGLYNRRMAEVALWKTADGPEAKPPPSSYTRSLETPPEPMPTKPLAQSKSFMTSCLAACTTAAGALAEWLKPVGDGAKKAADTIAPFAGQSEVVDHARTGIITIAAAVALAVPAFIWLKNYRSRTQ